MASPDSPTTTVGTASPLAGFLAMFNDPDNRARLPDADRIASRGSSDSSDYLMGSFFLGHPTTPRTLAIPAGSLKAIGVHFRELAKVAARANVQIAERRQYDYEELGEAYLEVLSGVQALQEALQNLGNEELTKLVNGSSIKTFRARIPPLLAISPHGRASHGDPLGDTATAHGHEDSLPPCDGPSSTRVRSSSSSSSTSTVRPHQDRDLSVAASTTAPGALWAQAIAAKDLINPTTPSDGSVTEHSFSDELRAMDLLTDPVMCADPITPRTYRTMVSIYAHNHGDIIVPTSCPHEIELCMPVDSI
ncbi:hypothetical protein C2E23DRAFT_884596 [Lenzites betulinus]|nr:hypothetical protein C2E23DRAFT_884596 [Lenzites betulinus]